MSQTSLKTWYLERTNLLRKLSASEMDLFQGEGTTIALKKSNVVDPSSQSTPCVYLVMEGFVKLVTLSGEGKRFSLAILNAGDFMGNVLGETSAPIEDEPEEFLEAMADSRLLRIGGDCFARVLGQNPALLTTVLQNIHGKSRLYQRKLSDLLFKDVHARIAQLFLDLVFTHGEECPYAFGLTHDLSLRHHEIAELIGASRPVTSIALGDFLKTDLIHKHDGFICLNDIENLKRVAEGGVKVLLALKQSALTPSFSPVLAT